MKNRKLLMIPGPIEFDPQVLAAMAEPTTSHVAPNFIEIFGQALERMRGVFLSTRWTTLHPGGQWHAGDGHHRREPGRAGRCGAVGGHRLFQRPLPDHPGTLWRPGNQAGSSGRRASGVG